MTMPKPARAERTQFARPARPWIAALIAAAGCPLQGVRGQAVKDAPAAAASRAATLREGDTGAAVEALQRTLNARLAPSPGLDVQRRFRRGDQGGGGPVPAIAGAGPDRSGRPEDARGPRAAARRRAAPSQAGGHQQRPKAPKQPADSLDGPPFVTAKAWAIASGRTGAVLWGQDEAKPLEMASLTKVMTGMIVVAMARADLNVMEEVVTFSEKADATPGSTSGVKAGERVPVRELLYGLLLPSGNDAATAFSEHLGDASRGPPARTRRRGSSRR